MKWTEAILCDVVVLIGWLVDSAMSAFPVQNEFHQWLDLLAFRLLKPLSVFCFFQQNSLSWAHSHSCPLLCLVIDRKELVFECLSR